jgi:hypothetical protein
MEEVKTLIAYSGEEYNHIKPYSALGYCPPAPQTWLCTAQLVSATGLKKQLVQSLGAGHLPRWHFDTKPFP